MCTMCFRVNKADVYWQAFTLWPVFKNSSKIGIGSFYRYLYPGLMLSTTALRCVPPLRWYGYIDDPKETLAELRIGWLITDYVFWLC